MSSFSRPFRTRLPGRGSGSLHPTDARLCHRALEKLIGLARRHGVPLRQSYRRLAKRAAIMVCRRRSDSPRKRRLNFPQV